MFPHWWELISALLPFQYRDHSVYLLSIHHKRAKIEECASFHGISQQQSTDCPKNWASQSMEWNAQNEIIQIQNKKGEYSF